MKDADGPKRRSGRSDKGAEGDAPARIIAAARRAFASTGYEGASTRGIAAAAGVAQSLLLYHYDSKEKLWRAVIDALIADAMARFADIFQESPHKTASRRLVALVHEFVALCAEDADLHRIMTIEGRQPTERLQWLVEHHLRPVYLAATNLVRAAQAEGTVRQGDPTLLYYSIIAIAGTAFSLAPEITLLTGRPDPVDPAAVEAIIHSVLLVPMAQAGSID